MQIKKRILEMAAVAEYDNSLNDFIERVRSEFTRQFATPTYSDSNPVYCWPTDIFTDHLIAREGDSYFRVTMEVTDEKITFAAKEDWEAVKLSYVTELLAAKPIREVMFVWELKSKCPDVAFADGVDVDALTDGDKNPVFVTLPIGKAEVKSGNGRYYDSAFVTELERQVLANKPIGLMGHLSAEARATDFPLEAVHWVGAKRVGELLWGKGYLPPGEARERLQRYKAAGKKIATSIDAVVAGVWDEKLQAHRMTAATLELNQIDIAPADRAGIVDLAAIPHLTKEMAIHINGTSVQTEDPEMDKLQMIREMTPEDAALLPQAVRDAIAAATQAPEVKQVQELRSALGLKEGEDLQAAITELVKAEKQRSAEAVKSRITELASDPEKGIKLPAVRGLVVELVTARNPATVAEAESVYSAVVQSDAVKAALEGTLKSAMGPAQRSTLGAQAGTAKYFPVPKVEAA